MTGRDPAEAHRAATPLELLFDLCFVVAIAQVGIALHHDLSEGLWLHGISAFAMVFFAIWWAWMNFTWFASAFDTDDVTFRLLTFVQIGGALVIAAGVPRAFDDADFTLITIGYVIMRMGLVTLWLRVALEQPALREVALRYAIGVTLVQLGWLGRLLLPPQIGTAMLAPLVALELLVPLWAERANASTPWHAGHVAERYGLFTIIVLGEVILAASLAVQEAVTAGGLSTDLVVLAFGALLLVAAMWWAYFKHDATRDEALRRRMAFAWGYGHYFVFASVAAVGAGLQVIADMTHEEAAIGPQAASLLVAVPVGVYLVTGWTVSREGRRPALLIPVGVAALALIAVALLVGSASPPLAVVAMGAIVATLIAVTTAMVPRAEAPDV